MKKNLAIIAAAVATTFSLGAIAQTPAADTSASAAGLSKDQAKDLKNHSEADYKSRKKISDAKLEQNKADCETAADGSLGRACKSDAKAQSKKEKADAKVIHEAEKTDIKANTATK